MKSVRVGHICYLHVVPQESTAECGKPEPNVFKRSSNCKRVTLALKQKILKCSQPEAKIKKMKPKIEN